MTTIGHLREVPTSIKVMGIDPNTQKVGAVVLQMGSNGTTVLEKETFTTQKGYTPTVMFVEKWTKTYPDIQCIAVEGIPNPKIKNEFNLRNNKFLTFQHDYADRLNHIALRQVLWFHPNTVRKGIFGDSKINGEVAKRRLENCIGKLIHVDCIENEHIADAIGVGIYCMLKGSLAKAHFFERRLFDDGEEISRLYYDTNKKAPRCEIYKNRNSSILTPN